jgi:threonine/homoserine/homoserine lactone efflux protein
MDLTTLWLFVVAVVVLLVTPGPAVLYVMARSIDQGRTAGFISVLGMATGGAIHVLAAAIGISALLMTSSMAFNIVKYLGAAYLIYLGVTKLFFSKAQTTTSEIAKEEPQKLTKVFYQSVIVEVLNPKTALFFLAFFPQFISTHSGSVTLQFLILGSIFIVIALLSDGLYALLASSIRNWLVMTPLRTKIQNWLTGGTYIAMGVFAAFVNPSQK